MDVRSEGTEAGQINNAHMAVKISKAAEYIEGCMYISRFLRLGHGELTDSREGRGEAHNFSACNRN